MKTRQKTVLSVLTALLLAAGSSIAIAQQPTLAAGEQMKPAVADMKSLIEQGRFADAFNLGLKNESMAGDPLYDYYFGIAAVDSGRASLGVLALERVLLTNPLNDLARLELARGYFVLQDYERSREEFQILLGKDLPPGVKESIKKYLAAIRDTDPDFRSTAKAYFEYSGGRNSNVSSSTSDSIQFPVRIGDVVFALPVNPTDKKSSALSQVAAGVAFNGPIVPGIKYYLGVDANVRQYSSIDEFDQQGITAVGGVEYAAEATRYRLFTFYSKARLDGQDLRDVYGLSVDVMRPISKETSLRSGITGSALRYADTLADVRDADAASFAFGLTHFIGGAWKWSVDADVTVGRERNLKGNAYLSRDIYGFRTVLNFLPGGRWKGNVTVGYTSSQYDAEDPLSYCADTASDRCRIKDEDLIAVELGLQYQLTRGWSIRGELARSENRSNIPLYKYEQDIFLVKMRYEWK